MAPGVSVVGMMRSLMAATRARCSAVKAAWDAVKPSGAVAAAVAARASGATSAEPNSAVAPTISSRRLAVSMNGSFRSTLELGRRLAPSPRGVYRFSLGSSPQDFLHLRTQIRTAHRTECQLKFLVRAAAKVAI